MGLENATVISAPVERRERRKLAWISATHGLRAAFGRVL